MEILATQSFLEGARRRPQGVSALVAALARQETPLAPGADPVDGGALLGWSRTPQQLQLFFLADARAARPAVTLASLSRAELRALGVPDARVREVQRADGLAGLEPLGLAPGVLRELRFKLLQLCPGLAGEPLARRALSADHLDRYLRGDITELLLNLDDGQRRLVELGGAGPILLRGVAGSGKTSVVLHRMWRLVEASRLAPPTVLLLTFNRALATAAKELLAQLGLPPRLAEVSTLHGFCTRRLRAGSATLTHTGRRALIAQAVREVRDATEPSALFDHPPEFWDSELHLIKTRVLAGREEYLALERVGARRRLGEQRRLQVWAVFERYQGLLKARRGRDWDDAVRDAHRHLEALGEGGPRYDHVFVDEAQDLPPLSLRLAASLARGGNVFLSYDPEQSLYERGFRWRTSGLTVHPGRSFLLRTNHRNTREILSTARGILTSLGERPEAEEAVLAPEDTDRSGAAPRVLTCAPGREAQALAADVRALIETQGVPPGNIGVLCFPNWKRDEVTRALLEAGVLYQEHSDASAIRLSDPSVKVLPLKSAKGLEFPVVYLVATGKLFAPPAELDQPADRTAWEVDVARMLYMAVTRAMSRLVIVHARGDLAPGLAKALGC